MVQNADVIGIELFVGWFIEEMSEFILMTIRYFRPDIRAAVLFGCILSPGTLRRETSRVY